MQDDECVQFLQWALPKMQLRWPGYRKVRSQVCKRLNRRLLELALSDPGAYRDYLQNHLQEWKNVETMCRVTISRFYRDKSVFHLLENVLIPYLCGRARQRNESTLRCWSAGCASGEEPYTLAILWQLGLCASYPQLDMLITATDIDSKLIQRAHKACYTYSSVKNLPELWRHQAFDYINGQFCLLPDIKKLVQFTVDDVAATGVSQDYHLILCRNLVFTYFNTARQLKFVNKLQQQLVEGGVLVLGVHETLPEEVTGWRRWHKHLPVYVRQ